MMERTHKEERGCDMGKRTDTEILKDLVIAIREYDSLRDDEWQFEEDNGDRDLWDAGTMDTHKGLLKSISSAREKMESLIQEATGTKPAQEKIPVSKEIEGVLDDAYEFVCNELEARGIPYDSSNTDKIFVNDKEEKKTHCINIFSSVCLAYEGE